jgi:hypothetical protein
VARYRFDHWEDGSTNSTRTITVTADITIRATYVLVEVKRNVRYESSPIAVPATIDTTPIPSGSVIQVPDGATITITVPLEVEA